MIANKTSTQSRYIYSRIVYKWGWWTRDYNDVALEHVDVELHCVHMPVLHWIHSDEPGVEYFPEVQFKHAVAPGGEYFPAGHILETDPEPLVEVLPYLSIEPAGHI